MVPGGAALVPKGGKNSAILRRDGTYELQQQPALHHNPKGAVVARIPWQ